MKNFIAFIYGFIMLIAFGFGIGYAFWKAPWGLGVLISLLFLWNVFIFIGKIRYPYFDFWQRK